MVSAKSCMVATKSVTDSDGIRKSGAESIKLLTISTKSLRNTLNQLRYLLKSVHTIIIQHILNTLQLWIC